MKYVCLLINLLLIQSVLGQAKLPIIRATSRNVAIRDGDYFDKNAWSLSQKIKPDVYTADRSRQPKWVVFYTDVDSIKIKVAPGTSFDFIVLLNGKDSCYTRIASAIPPASKQKSVKNTHDTIPFTLTAKNAIHVKSILNNTDTLNLHFDVGSFDFRITQAAILSKTKLLANQPDALARRTKPNFNQLEKVHTLKMGKMVWTNPVIVPTLLTATDMDGRFGWNLFEGKSVEIDYDKSLLIIHSKPPKNLKGYKQSKLEFLRSFVCIQGSITANHKTYTGPFMLDTGSDKAMILDSIWASKQRFPTDLPLVSVTTFRNPRGEKFETKTVLSPQLSLNGLPLSKVPATLLGSRNPANFEVNFLGNDVLKRFNTVLDFKNDLVYLKPNKFTDIPYLETLKQ